MSEDGHYRRPTNYCGIPVSYSSNITVRRTIEMQRVKTCSFCGQQSSISKRKNDPPFTSYFVSTQHGCWGFTRIPETAYREIKGTVGCVICLGPNLQQNTDEVEIPVQDRGADNSRTILKYVEHIEGYSTDRNTGRAGIRYGPKVCECSRETLMKFNLDDVGSIINLVPGLYCSRRVNMALSSRYALMCLYHQLYNSFENATMNLLLAENDKMDDVMMEHQKIPVFMKPNLYVTHWVTRDLVLGYRLSDCSFGLSFKDRSSMILSEGRHLYFVNDRGQISYYDDWEDIPSQLEKKVNMLDTMIRRLHERYPLTSVPYEHGETPLYDVPFVVKWLLLRNNMIFYFSDGTMEIHLDDENGRRRLILAPLFKALCCGEMVGEDEVRYFEPCTNKSLLRKDLFLALTICKRFVRFYYTRQIPYLFFKG